MHILLPGLSKCLHIYQHHLTCTYSVIQKNLLYPFSVQHAHLVCIVHQLLSLILRNKCLYFLMIINTHSQRYMHVHVRIKSFKAHRCTIIHIRTLLLKHPCLLNIRHSTLADSSVCMNDNISLLYTLCKRIFVFPHKLKLKSHDKYNHERTGFQ